jgi:hypothetical protein
MTFRPGWLWPLRDSREEAQVEDRTERVFMGWALGVRACLRKKVASHQAVAWTASYSRERLEHASVRERETLFFGKEETGRGCVSCE